MRRKARCFNFEISALIYAGVASLTASGFHPDERASSATEAGPLIGVDPVSQFRIVRLPFMSGLASRNAAASPDCVSPSWRRAARIASGVIAITVRCNYA
jgi:hypothetical protein